VLGHRTWCQ